jgi:hypothetical protein
VPFHAYEQGNLNWTAAYEVEPASYAMALRTFKGEGLSGEAAMRRLREGINREILVGWCVSVMCGVRVSAMCSVRCEVCSLWCAVCSVQCAVCSVQCAVCCVQFVVCGVWCAGRVGGLGVHAL